MKNLKFSGLSFDKNFIIYGGLIQVGNSTKINSEMSNGASCAVDVLPNSIRQFTGFKDSDGNELYDGDVVNYGENGVDKKAEIVFDKKKGMWATDVDKSLCSVISKGNTVKVGCFICRKYYYFKSKK